MAFLCSHRSAYSSHRFIFRSQLTKYTGFGSTFIGFLGTPVNALMVGVLLSFLLLPSLSEETLSGWVGKGLLDSANILLITGAGGSLGASAL